MGNNTQLKMAAIVCCIAAALALPTPSIAQQSSTTKEELEAFFRACSPSFSSPKVDLTFAPVEELQPGERQGQQWNYKFTTNDRRYPEDRVVLDESRQVPVWMVSTLYRSDSDNEDSYMWHVIAAPRPPWWLFGGHWTLSSRYSYSEELTTLRSTMLNYAYNGKDPVHKTLRDFGRRSSLNDAWEQTFGTGIMDSVFAASNAVGEAQTDHYSMTFYYVLRPKDLTNIQDDGYRWPSSKNIFGVGDLFGFVLSAKTGDCLASAKLRVTER